METSGTADVAGNVITVSDLEYGRVYRVSITAVGDHCPDLETVSVVLPVSPVTTSKDTACAGSLCVSFNCWYLSFFVVVVLFVCLFFCLVCVNVLVANYIIITECTSKFHHKI